MGKCLFFDRLLLGFSSFYCLKSIFIFSPASASFFLTTKQLHKSNNVEGDDWTMKKFQTSTKRSQTLGFRWIEAFFKMSVFNLKCKIQNYLAWLLLTKTLGLVYQRVTFSIETFALENTQVVLLPMFLNQESFSFHRCFRGSVCWGKVHPKVVVSTPDQFRTTNQPLSTFQTPWLGPKDKGNLPMCDARKWKKSENRSCNHRSSRIRSWWPRKIIFHDEQSIIKFLLSLVALLPLLQQRILWLASQF